METERQAIQAALSRAPVDPVVNIRPAYYLAYLELACEGYLVDFARLAPTFALERDGVVNGLVGLSEAARALTFFANGLKVPLEDILATYDAASESLQESENNSAEVEDEEATLLEQPTDEKASIAGVLASLGVGSSLQGNLLRHLVEVAGDCRKTISSIDRLKNELSGDIDQLMDILVEIQSNCIFHMLGCHLAPEQLDSARLFETGLNNVLSNFLQAFVDAGRESMEI